MKLALAQMHSVPEAIVENTNKAILLFEKAVAQGADCIVYPELCTCGYYLETPAFEKAAAESAQVLQTFCELAKKNHIVVVLPVPQRINDTLYIGLYVIESDGTVIADYQKSFLWGREQQYFTHGIRDYKPVKTSVGTLGLLICYDIEFPEPARVLALRGAELILVPSVWSIPAQGRWNIQLPARGLDNTIFVAGINNVGEGACGQSKVVSPMGEVIAEASANDEMLLLVDVDFSNLQKVREKIPYLKEYDSSLSPSILEKV